MDVKVFKRKWNETRREGPHKVILTTPTVKAPQGYIGNQKIKRNTLSTPLRGQTELMVGVILLLVWQIKEMT